MNRERDFDQTLRNWLDDGADRAPERFVWAALQDVEHTDQRGARWALLEGFLMKIKPAAPILGVAAVVLLAIAMFQFLGGNVGGPDPTPTPRSYSSEELAAILVSERTAPEGLTFARSQEGGVSLVIPLRPGGPTFQMDAFVESLTNYFDGPGTADAYEGYVSWSALFVTNGDAERAFDFLVRSQNEDGEEGEASDSEDLQRMSVEQAEASAEDAQDHLAHDLFDILVGEHDVDREAPLELLQVRGVV